MWRVTSCVDMDTSLRSVGCDVEEVVVVVVGMPSGSAVLDMGVWRYGLGS